MAIHTTNWEDEENNRIVQLTVEYSVAGSRIEIEDVTPTSILFIDAATRTPRRRIRLWTDTARRLLRTKHADTVGVETLREQLESELLTTAG